MGRMGQDAGEPFRASHSRFDPCAEGSSAQTFALRSPKNALIGGRKYTAPAEIFRALNDLQKCRRSWLQRYSAGFFLL